MDQQKSDYKKISQDPDCWPPYPPRSGPSRESCGRLRHGVYLQTFKHSVAKRYIRNGNILCTFRYPKIDQTFHSELLNDYNQHLCGGWYWNYKENGSPRSNHEYNSEIILERVLGRKKPLGDITVWDEKKDKIKLWQKLIDKSNLSYILHKKNKKNEFIICRSGVLDNFFNFDSLITDYTNFDRAKSFNVFRSSKNIKTSFNSIRKNNLKKYLHFDYLSPACNFDFAITGLILGYPIENTYALLTE